MDHSLHTAGHLVFVTPSNSFGALRKVQSKGRYNNGYQLINKCHGAMHISYVIRGGEFLYGLDAFATGRVWPCPWEHLGGQCIMSNGWRWQVLKVLTLDFSTKNCQSLSLNSSVAPNVIWEIQVDAHAQGFYNQQYYQCT